MDFKGFLVMAYFGSLLSILSLIFLINSGLFSPSVKLKLQNNVLPELNTISENLNEIGERLSISGSSDISGFGQYFGLLYNILILVINVALVLVTVPAKAVTILFFFLTEILGSNYLFDQLVVPLQVITTTLYLFAAYMYVARGEVL